MLRALPLAVLLALPGVAYPPVVAAQVRRCQLPTGQTVYTDRRCDSIGGVERAAAAGQPRLRIHRTACARTVRDLYFEVSAALESRDANRLAGVYHWPGMSTRQGYDVMKRLQTLVDRSLVDLQPVYPGADEDSYASPARPPVAFRIEQVAANGSTPVRASLGIRRHLGCWWVSLGGHATARPRVHASAVGADAPSPPAAADAPRTAPSDAQATPDEAPRGERP
jgi:hypothetical protein